MKAVRFHAAKDIRVEDVPAPELGPGDLVVVVSLRFRSVHRRERRGYRSGDVADRDPDALGTEVDAECTNAGNATGNTIGGRAHAPAATASTIA